MMDEPPFGKGDRMHRHCSSSCSAYAQTRLPFLLIFASIFLATLACGGSETIITEQPGTSPPQSENGWTPGDHALTMMADGIQRSYVVHIPTGFNRAQPTALVLAFHGIGLDAEEMMRISKLNDQADVSGFIVVYPEGSGTTRSWNGGHCCGSAAAGNVDDVGFVRALLDELSDSLPVDPQRIHATGFSNGAIFTYRLACELSDRIASFAPVSATPAELDLGLCASDQQAALIHIHGTADVANPYEGGELPSGFYFLSVGETMRFWAERNDCDPQSQTSTSGSITHEVYGSCAPGTALELYSIAGGAHAWPGGEAVNHAMGEPNMEMNAAEVIWEFFQSHPLP